MAVFRVDVLVLDPDTVFNWITENVASDLVVRKIAYKTVKGWYIKAVFKRQIDAESFHCRWHPESDTHAVAPF